MTDRTNDASHSDCNGLRSKLLEAVLDDWSCEELADGRVVVGLPFVRSDGDHVELLARRLEGFSL